MKNLIITLLIALTIVITTTANERDTLWKRYTTSGMKDLDFTPDDKYVIAWTNSIEFWNVETATMDFILPNIKVGGMTPDEKYLVFIQDGVPKMLDIETKEIIDGFEPPTFSPNHVKVGNDNNIFMCFNEEDSLFIWDIETKRIEKIFSIETDFIENGEEMVREITDYGFAGNNDDFLFVSIFEENKYASSHPNKINRRYSKFIYRQELMLFDSLNWISKYKPMNHNKDIIAIDKVDGTIDLYKIRDKLTINSIKFDDIKLSTDDLEFDIEDEILGLTQGSSCCRYLKLFRLSDNKLIFEFNDNYSSWDQFKISNNQQKFVASTGSSLYMYSNQWKTTDVENKLENRSQLLITPNPSSNTISVGFDMKAATDYKLSIVDVLGNVVDVLDTGAISSNRFTQDYDISSLLAGTYFIRLEMGDEVITKQFIKE